MGQPASPLCGSVWGQGLERGQCYCLASGGLPSTHPISSYFAPSLYATRALPAVALVLNPRGGGFLYTLRPWEPFKQSLLKSRQFFPPPQPPLVFTARCYGDLSSQRWNPGLCRLAWIWDSLLPRYPSRFLFTCEFGTTHLQVSTPLSV